MKRDPQSPETIFGEAIDIAAPDERAAYLDRACENDPDLRGAVEQLVVDHFRAGRFLETPVAQFAATINMPGEASHGEQPGTQIGPYKLLQQIGEGGMGTVYMAEQTQPVQRRVALKVIKAGMDSSEVIARFEAERQALAMMDHPNIAKVLDAGTTGDGEKGVGSLLCTAPDGPSRQKTPDPFFSGRPYFVMELVKGLPITRYCDEHHLSLRERLELFVPVLQAVQHAHQKGIIHRDLKPSNVLIAEYDDRAVPKIIDFGVAKAAGGTLTEKTMFTQLGQLVGTLEYMSPEQAKFNQLDVDTRTDIYAMGVLLYELLTGTTPFGRQRLHAAAFDEMLRILREEEPPKPSTRLTTIDNLLTVAANRHIEPARLSKFLRGELDWIVMKALEKDRNRRYETANGFASDVQRYLSDEAVQACPPSAAYRFRKLVQRNKGAFAFVSTVAVGVLLAVVMLAVSYVRITRETALKEQALKDKHAALTAAQASEKDANTKEALAKAAQNEAQENLNDARAAVDQMLTRVSQERLLYIPQMEHVRRELLEDALKFYQKFLEKKGDDPVLRRETAWAYRRLAGIQRSLGQLVEAEMSFRKAFAMFEELEAQSLLGPSTRADLVHAHLQFARFLCELGKREEPEEHLRRAVQMAEDLVKEFPKDSAYDELLVAANLNLITLTRRPPDQEEEMLRRNLKLTKDTYLVEYIYWHLGLLGVRQGRYPEAKKDYLKALEKCETVASENPSSSSAQRDLGMIRVDLADAMAADGQREEAESLYRRAIAILDKLAIDYPGIHVHRAEQAVAHYKYATVLKTLDRTADAEQAYRRAVDLYAKLAADFAAIPAYQQIAFDQRLELGRFLVEAGRAQDAQQIYGEAFALSGKLTADFPTRLNHWQGLVRSHIELGRLLEISGKTPEAEEAFRQALAISKRLEAEHGGKPDYRREVARSHLDAAWILRFANRHSETEQLYRWALEHFVRLAGESPQSLEPRQDLAFAHFLLADHYRWAPGRLQDSEKLFRQALEEYQKLSADFPDVPGYHITSADCRERLASVLLYQGRLQEAELALEEALALAERLAEQHPADRTVRMTLAMGSRHWGETLWRMARPQEVEKAFRRTEAILEKLAADFPHESWYQLEWGLACQMFVALLARDLKQPQEAEEFYRRAVASFEKLAAEFPHDLSHRTRLAIVHREWASCLEAIGRTQEAKEIFELTITNFSKAIELGSKDIWGVWYPQALLHLSTGQTKEYRTLCERLLERFGQASDPDFWVVIICKLAPDAVADLTRPVQFAEQMLARNPDDAELVGILGDALYRKGDLDAAVLRLEASIRGAPGIGVHWRRLFLAMAYHRLGRTAEAQQLLKETTQWMEKNAQAKLAEGAELSQPLAWQLRLDLQLLRREAATLIAGEESH